MGFRLRLVSAQCGESFADLPGLGATRRCDTCGKDVHDVSALTEDEARALFEGGRRICARVVRDASGTIQFRAAAVAVALAASACSAAVADGPPPAATVQIEDLGDMVPDSIDRCPDSPGTDGCPAAADAGPAKH